MDKKGQTLIYRIGQNLNTDANFKKAAMNDATSLLTGLLTDPEVIAAGSVFASGKPNQRTADLIDGITDRYEYLLREYNRTMTEKGLIRRRSELKKMNLLDVRNLLELPEEKNFFPNIHMTESDTGFMTSHGFYSIIPCFETGVIQVNDGRYIYFSVKEVNLETETIVMKLEDYSYSGLWELLVRTMTQFSFIKNESDGYFRTDITVLSETPECELFTILDQKDLGWNDSDMDFFKRTRIHFTEQAEKRCKAANSSFGVESSRFFITAIIKANACLEKNRPSRPVGTKRKKINSGAVMETAKSSASFDEKKIRYVGPMQVKSKQIPKLPARETVIHYKTATWQQRGFTRTYKKSGKQVYIKPQTKHRKALQDNSSGEVTKITLKFNDSSAIRERK